MAAVAAIAAAEVFTAGAEGTAVEADTEAVGMAADSHREEAVDPKQPARIDRLNGVASRQTAARRGHRAQARRHPGASRHRRRPATPAAS